MTADFSVELWKPKDNGMASLKVLKGKEKKKACQLRILYSVQISFKIKVKHIFEQTKAERIH